MVDEQTVVEFFSSKLGAEPLRQIAPARTGSGHPQQGVDKPPAIAPRAPLALQPTRHERLDPFPLIVPKHFTFQDRLQ